MLQHHSLHWDTCALRLRVFSPIAAQQPAPAVSPIPQPLPRLLMCPMLLDLDYEVEEATALMKDATALLPGPAPLLLREHALGGGDGAGAARVGLARAAQRPGKGLEGRLDDVVRVLARQLRAGRWVGRYVGRQAGRQAGKQFSSAATCPAPHHTTGPRCPSTHSPDPPPRPVPHPTPPTCRMCSVMPLVLTKLWKKCSTSCVS